MYIVTEFNAFEMKKPLVFTDELEACKHLASAIVNRAYKHKIIDKDLYFATFGRIKNLIDSDEIIALLEDICEGRKNICMTEFKCSMHYGRFFNIVIQMFNVEKEK